MEEHDNPANEPVWSAYNDDYPTCEDTHATLRIYPGAIDPQIVTKHLGIEPSSWQRKGEVLPGDTKARLAKLSGWFLESEGHINSKDCRRHIDWILDQVYPRAKELNALQQQGCRMDITCFWISRDGHGGPTVQPIQMKRLSELNLPLWFDFYAP